MDNVDLTSLLTYFCLHICGQYEKDLIVFGKKPNHKVDVQHPHHHQIDQAGKSVVGCITLVYMCGDSVTLESWAFAIGALRGKEAEARVHHAEMDLKISSQKCCSNAKPC